MLETLEGESAKNVYACMWVISYTVTLTGLSEYKGSSVFSCKPKDLCLRVLRIQPEVKFGLRIQGLNYITGR